MVPKCLYCYKELGHENDFHEKCSRMIFGTPLQPKIPYTLDQMAELAKYVVEQSVAVPGVQPKLSMSLVKEAGQTANRRLTVVGTLGGDYIFKPPSEDFTEMPQNEHVTMRIAEAYGIRVVPSSLIRLQSGEISYITKRIDRTNNGQRIHMLDMFQILEAFDKYKSSMERVGKAVGEYSANPLLDKLFLFEMTLFSFLTGNNDMHLKNFSMIQTGHGWGLSPAYDLLNISLVLLEDKEELALTLGGKKRKLTKNSFKRFGEGLGLNSMQINGVFNRFLKNKKKAFKWIDNSFLSEDQKEGYKAIITERYERL